jgi:hypothetical protein
MQSVSRCKIAACLAAGSLAALAGCGSLHTIVADMAQRPAQAVQFEGARGPLSSGQSKVIRDRLKSGGAQTSIFDRQAARSQEDET